MKTLPIKFFIIPILLLFFSVLFLSDVSAQTVSCSTSVICGGSSTSLSSTQSHDCKFPNGTYNNAAASCSFTGGCNVDGSINESWSTSCGGGGGDNPPPITESYKIAGNIVSCQTQAPISNVKVNVLNGAGDSWQVSTNSQGFFELNNAIYKDNYYAVRPDNSSIDTNWFIPLAKTTTNGWSWNYGINPNPGTQPWADTPLGSGGYEGQKAGSGTDCSGPNGSGQSQRCNFCIDERPDPVTPPVGYTCSADNKSATVTWATDINADYYALRLDDLNDGWSSSIPDVCARGTNGLNGDYCLDILSSSPSNFTFSITPNAKHHFWYHSVQNNGRWAPQQDLQIECNDDVTQSVARFRGRRTAGPDSVATTIKIKGLDINDASFDQTYSIDTNTTSGSAHTYSTGNNLVCGGAYNITFANITGYKAQYSYVQNGTSHPESSYIDAVSGLSLVLPTTELAGQNACIGDLYFRYIPDTTPDLPTVCTTITPASSSYVGGDTASYNLLVRGEPGNNFKVSWKDTCGGNFNSKGSAYTTSLYTHTLSDQAISADNLTIKNQTLSGCKIQAQILSPTNVLEATCTDATYNITNSLEYFIDLDGTARSVDNLETCPLPSDPIWNTNWASQDKVSGGTIRFVPSTYPAVATTITSGNFTASVQVPSGASYLSWGARHSNSNYVPLCIYDESNNSIIAPGGSLSVNTTTLNLNNLKILFGYAPPSYITAGGGGEVFGNAGITITKPNTTSVKYFQPVKKVSKGIGGVVISPSGITSGWGDKTTEKLGNDGVSGYAMGYDFNEYLNKIINEVLPAIAPNFGSTIEFEAPPSGTLELDSADLLGYEGKVLVVNGNVNIKDGNGSKFNNPDPYKVTIISNGEIFIDSGVSIASGTTFYDGSLLTTSSFSFNRQKAHSFNLVKFVNNPEILASNVITKNWGASIEDNSWSTVLGVPIDSNYQELQSVGNENFVSAFVDDVESYINSSSTYNPSVCDTEPTFIIKDLNQFKEGTVSFEDLWNGYNNEVVSVAGNLTITDVAGASENHTDIILKPKPYNVDIEISYDEDYTYQDPQDGQVTVCKSEYLNTPLKTATESFEYPYTFVEFEGQKYIEDDALYIQKRVYPMNDFFLDPENYVKPDLGIFKVSNVIWREILN